MSHPRNTSRYGVLYYTPRYSVLHYRILKKTKLNRSRLRVVMTRRLRRGCFPRRHRGLLLKLSLLPPKKIQNPSDQDEFLLVVPRSPTPPSEIQPIAPISESVHAELQESAPRSPIPPSEAQGVVSDYSSSISSNIDVAHQQQAVTANSSSSDKVQAMQARNNEKEAAPDMVSFVDATDLEDRSTTRRESFTPNEMSTIHRFLNTIVPTSFAGFADTGSGLALQLRDLINEHANKVC